MLIACAVPSAHANIREGLVGWWKLDETSGTTAIDWSGQNNNGTYNGTTALPAGQCKRGGCRSFGGSSDNVNCGANSSLVANVMSFSLWVYPNSYPQNGNYMESLRKESSYEVVFGTSVGGGCSTGVDVGFKTASGGASNLVCVNFLYVPLQSWTLLTATADGTNVKVFVNGQFYGSTAYAGNIFNTVSNHLFIGAYGTTNPGGRYFAGRIDDVRIYNRALTAQEVSDLYRSGIVLRSGVWRNAKFNQ